jgi:hypothetical protein
MGLFFVGMLMAGLIPPPSPHASTMQVAGFWQDHLTLTRLGLFLMMVAGALVAPFGTMLCVIVRRIEGRDAPMTYLQVIGTTTLVLAILVPTMIFMTAAFRPYRDPNLTKLLNDLGWIPFVVEWPPAFLMCLSVTGAALTDRSPHPVFPRWVGYYSAWTAFLYLPGGLIIFFKQGAFAWNGLLAFWLVAVAFGAWVMVMSVLMMRARSRDDGPVRRAIVHPETEGLVAT